MPIKTIEIPTAYHAHAERVHRTLLAPPELNWTLDFRPINGLRVPFLTLWSLGPLQSYIGMCDCRLDLTREGERLTAGQQSIDLGACRLTLPDLSSLTFRSTDLFNGTLRLPPITVELPGLPDPTTVSLTAEPDRRSFLLHLVGGLTGAAFDVRLTF